MTNGFMTGGSLTTASPCPSGLWPATSASARGSVIASPWNQRSPVSSSTYTAGHPLSGVSGVIPTKLSRITASHICDVPMWASTFDLLHSADLRPGIIGRPRDSLRWRRAESSADRKHEKEVARHKHWPVLALAHGRRETGTVDQRADELLAEIQPLRLTAAPRATSSR